MLIKKAQAIKFSEITEKKHYINRRQFLASSASLAASGFFIPHSYFQKDSRLEQKLTVEKKGEYVVQDRLTPYEEAATYTNFYEFSTGKRSVKELSRDFRTRPWSLSVEGLVKDKITFDIDELIHMFPLEERIYRWRCVEAWSMVLPWVGFPLSDFVKKCQPASKAQFVEFETVYAPERMPGQRTRVLDWPYTEALRLDEAMHPLALMAVGLYGEILPNQNGAPIRIVVPWKYGFKSAKSIVKVRFVEKMPKTSWRKANSREYGFYANVNPDVEHPRWSQARERRIGEEGKRPTLMFNGYADEVGHLYSGMDLKKNY
ncbi:MAG: protein-methionine-sulfoxide reductase catalytic subunit MsrP [Candidatus Aminicenantaceae bacterium]